MADTTQKSRRRKPGQRPRLKKTPRSPETCLPEDLPTRSLPSKNLLTRNLSPDLPIRSLPRPYNLPLLPANPRKQPHQKTPRRSHPRGPGTAPTTGTAGPALKGPQEDRLWDPGATCHNPVKRGPPGPGSSTKVEHSYNDPTNPYPPHVRPPQPTQEPRQQLEATHGTQTTALTGRKQQPTWTATTSAPPP